MGSKSVTHDIVFARLEIDYVMPPTFMSSVAISTRFFRIYLIDRLNCLLLLGSWVSIDLVFVFLSQYSKTSPPTTSSLFVSIIHDYMFRAYFLAIFRELQVWSKCTVNVATCNW